MNAVLRVWWTFFTAIPLQRWLAFSGIFLAALLAIPALGLREPLFWFFSALAFFVLIMFPTLFASAAVFRGLSAPRATRLLPRFRTRMLAAILSLQGTGILFFSLLFLPLAWTGDRAVPLEPIYYAFAFATATFMAMFLLFGDTRWIWLWLGVSVGTGVLGLSAGHVLAAIPVTVWVIAPFAIWASFGVWYLRAPRIKPISLLPRASERQWVRVELADTLTRAHALRMLVSAQPPRNRLKLFVLLAGIALLAANLLAFVAPAVRVMPFTSFVWSLATMLLLWTKSTAIVHRSRQLWLRIPGSRAAVRREVERALLRNLAGAGLLLLGLAALYGSPLVAAPPQQVLMGFALAACAGILGTYAAFAAVPGNFVQLVCLALLILLQVAVLASPTPDPADVVIVTAIELLAALAFRAWAIARWRRIDWLRVRSLPQSSLFRNA